MTNPVADFLLAPIRMIQEIRTIGGGINRWGAALNIPQIIGGVVFIGTPEGAAILLVELSCLLIAGQIHRRERFSRLISICHIPWLFLLPWLIWRFAIVEHSAALTIWLAYVIAAIAISLVFDVIELMRYAKGGRVFAWAKGE